MHFASPLHAALLSLTTFMLEANAATIPEPLHPNILIILAGDLEFGLVPLAV